MGSNIIFVVGSIFGFLGAVMAYLIVYDEYVHHYPSAREPRRIALRSSIVTLIFFVGLSLLLSYILPILFTKQ